MPTNIRPWLNAVCLRPILLGLALAGLAGCAIISPNSNSSGVDAETPDEKLAFNQINKAAKLPKPERIEAFSAIASQLDLDDNCQAYLVYKTFRCLRDDEDRMLVLHVLMKSEAFSLAAQIRIEYEERHLHSDAARSQIETELDRRALPSE